MTTDLPLRLNCTRCNEFHEYGRESENVVRCEECGKRHSNANLYIINLDKEYRRDENGELLEEPP